MIINKCPNCGRKLRDINDKDGFLIYRWCKSCGESWSIFDLEVKSHKKNNLEKWM